MKYYQHIQKDDVICEVLNNGKVARFGKWVWSGDTCTEVYKTKEVTPEFKRRFVEITQTEYNNIWGIKLQNA